MIGAVIRLHVVSLLLALRVGAALAVVVSRVAAMVADGARDAATAVERMYVGDDPGGPPTGPTDPGSPRLL